MPPSHMSVDIFAQSIVRLGETLSVDTTDLRALCLKMTVLNFTFVDRRTVWERLFPDHFVDWDLVKGVGDGVNSVGEVDLWITFLDLCKWREAPHMARGLPPPIADMCNGLREIKMDCDDFTLTCKLLLLHLLVGVPSLRAFQMVMCRSDRGVGAADCAALLASLSEKRHLPIQYEAAVVCILGDPGLEVDIEPLEAAITRLRSRSEERQLFYKMRELAVAGGRLRLRDLQRKTEVEQLALDVNLCTWESFHGWSLLHQFPNVLSESVKHCLYFLAAQTTFDWASLLYIVLGRDSALTTRIAQYPVSKPDVAILSKVIGEMQMRGSAPFPELIRFKNECFRHFPLTVLEHMTLTQVLRLYVSAYQNPLIWREIWKQHANLLSPQIVRDCRSFVENNAFAGEVVVRWMLK